MVLPQALSSTDLLQSVWGPEQMPDNYLMQTTFQMAIKEKSEQGTEW